MPCFSSPVDGDAPVDLPADDGGHEPADDRVIIRVHYRQATTEGPETVRGHGQLMSSVPLAHYETLCW